MPRKTKAERQRAKAKQRKRSANIQKARTGFSYTVQPPSEEINRTAFQDLEDLEDFEPLLLDELTPELVELLDNASFDRIESVCADAARTELDNNIPQPEFIDGWDSLTLAMTNTYFAKYRPDRKTGFEEWESRERAAAMREIGLSLGSRTQLAS
ncbi:hypothetical protein GZ77_26750 [Endozoicomonas montiporae]|uniref:Uncharacterized protein n=1 Tax=Endozoicomonas montiporae TaxID=1027273 RepID=A0A081MYC4_9GAMM|nr:hypothetical protein [Endozoicomonas montiporae]KEQ11197.1 hypothetical protein GZ77_26750 [Endozoicomonas montiporae]